MDEAKDYEAALVECGAGDRTGDLTGFAVEVLKRMYVGEEGELVADQDLGADFIGFVTERASTYGLDPETLGLEVADV